MNSRNALTSAVMLETLWNTRRNDIIDLVTPFVESCIAKTTSPNEKIDIQRVISEMETLYGYENMPEIIIKKVLNRHTDLFCRKNADYYLAGSLDETVAKIEKRKEECSGHIDCVGNSLFPYLQSHCRHEKVQSKDQVICALHKFFTYYGLDIGVDRLKIDEFSTKNSEINYYIAKYIIEKRAENGREYNSLISLVKGYYLEAAIYIQPENGNLMSATYKNVAFYYDTPFLLQLLGYQSSQEEQKAKSLHKMLGDLGGKFLCFPQTHDEIVSILTAYGHSIENRTTSSRTLVGLDEKKYTSSDVARIRNNFQKTLETTFGIVQTHLPIYRQKEDGTVDVSQVINEKSLENFIRARILHYKVDSLSADITSAVSIHKLRSGYEDANIENCRHLFVTTNRDFVAAFNSFYRQNVNANTFDLTIDANRLAALTWVKCANIAGELPELQLLENAYAAQQLPTELMEKLNEVLYKMEREGVMTYDEAVSIRTDHYAQKEILLRTKGDVEAVTDAFVEDIRNDYREHLIAQTRIDTTNDVSKSFTEQIKKKEIDLRHRAERKANETAKAEMKQFKKRISTILYCLAGAIIVLSVIGCIKSTSLEANIPWVIFMLISIISIYDTVASRKMFVSRSIEKWAHSHETKVFDREYKKYMEVYTEKSETAGEQRDVCSMN